MRNRRAILNLFGELMDEKMYGKGPHTAFARYLVGTWAPGVVAIRYAHQAVVAADCR